ncbi:MAG: thiamine biosynthesis protein ThiS [Planctomyces sp.]|nr:thiamine biosynthesis protein ThiS [Planctomyces sp.]
MAELDPIHSSIPPNPAATITVQINSQPREVPAGTTLTDLISILQLEPRYLAIERNAQVVSRKVHATTILAAGDVLEVVTLVGGG